MKHSAPMESEKSRTVVMMVVEVMVMMVVAAVVRWLRKRSHGVVFQVGLEAKVTMNEPGNATI